jgi:CRISPR-associated protein Cmr3
MHKEDELIRLQIGEIVECDLGHVRLPEFPKDKKGYKNLEQSWIGNQGMQALLKGTKLPDKEQIFSVNQLMKPEARLGIARNNETGSAIEGMLYQTQHIRLMDDVKIELDLHDLDDTLQKNLKQTEIVRLGGEGRTAALTIGQECEKMPFIRTNTAPLSKIIIHFISHAYFNGKMFPSTFTEQQVGEQTVWQGALNGIELRIEAAVIGKVHREGGWDMKKHQPRSVKSYIPAGSAWFCSVVDDSLSGADVVQALHEQCIGLEQQWGRGQILIGKWLDDKQGETNGN